MRRGGIGGHATDALVERGGLEKRKIISITVWKPKGGEDYAKCYPFLFSIDFNNGFI